MTFQPQTHAPTTARKAGSTTVIQFRAPCPCVLTAKPGRESAAHHAPMVTIARRSFTTQYKINVKAVIRLR
ncbi:hypothetical protein DPMN_183106 [Dreissena polymorpha]|uniref:Uncharacterized protein n=1 Tax=Dreissena polymorpha TaxID=45954 RepID=A0A9D4I597_DREPO|nr:hypothetical protein DPMN_183106 [Dreissena polymorpha]